MGNSANRRTWLVTVAGAALSMALAPLARAAGYPARPLKLLVGAPPGGPSDFLARLYGETMAPVLGQPLVVDNKPGASGTLAAEAAAKSPADGHVLLVSGPTAITVAPYLFKVGFDPSADFVPVSMVGAGAFVLAVHPSVPAQSVQELVALARGKPGALAFGSGGNGSTGHLCTELFCQGTGVKMVHVPYKGDGQAVNDLLAGQLQLMFTAPNVVMPQVRAGKLRLLAVTTRERVPSLPGVPTISETAVKDFECLGWIAVFAPAATPKAVIESLVAAWNKARATPSVRDRLDELGMVAPERLTSGEPLAQFVKAESGRLVRVVRDAGIKAE